MFAIREKEDFEKNMAGNDVNVTFEEAEMKMYELEYKSELIKNVEQNEAKIDEALSVILYLYMFIFAFMFLLAGVFYIQLF